MGLKIGKSPGKDQIKVEISYTHLGGERQSLTERQARLQ
jgi:hypothetical protein